MGGPVVKCYAKYKIDLRLIENNEIQNKSSEIKIRSIYDEYDIHKIICQ